MTKIREATHPASLASATTVARDAVAAVAPRSLPSTPLRVRRSELTVDAASRCMDASLAWVVRVVECATDAVRSTRRPRTDLPKWWWRSAQRLIGTTVQGWHALVTLTAAQRLWSSTRLGRVADLMHLLADSLSAPPPTLPAAIEAWCTMCGLQSGLVSILAAGLAQPLLRRSLHSPVGVDPTSARGHVTSNELLSADPIIGGPDSIAGVCARLAWTGCREFLSRLSTAGSASSTELVHMLPLVEQTMGFLCAALSSPEFVHAVRPLFPQFLSAPWPAAANACASPPARSAGPAGATSVAVEHSAPTWIDAISLTRLLLHAGLSVQGLTAIAEHGVLPRLVALLHTDVFQCAQPHRAEESIEALSSSSSSSSSSPSSFWHLHAPSARLFTSALRRDGRLPTPSIFSGFVAAPVCCAWTWSQTLQLLAHVSLHPVGLQLVASCGLLGDTLAYVRALLFIPHRSTAALESDSPCVCGQAPSSATVPTQASTPTDDWQQQVNEVQRPLARALHWPQDAAAGAGGGDPRLRALTVLLRVLGSPGMPALLQQSLSSGHHSEWASQWRAFWLELSCRWLSDHNPGTCGDEARMVALQLFTTLASHLDALPIMALDMCQGRLVAKVTVGPRLTPLDPSLFEFIPMPATGLTSPPPMPDEDPGAEFGSEVVDAPYLLRQGLCRRFQASWADAQLPDGAFVRVVSTSLSSFEIETEHPVLEAARWRPLPIPELTFPAASEWTALLSGPLLTPSGWPDPLAAGDVELVLQAWDRMAVVSGPVRDPVTDSATTLAVVLQGLTDPVRAAADSHLTATAQRRWWLAGRVAAHWLGLTAWTPPATAPTSASAADRDRDSRPLDSLPMTRALAARIYAVLQVNTVATRLHAGPFSASSPALSPSPVSAGAEPDEQWVGADTHHHHHHHRRHVWGVRAGDDTGQEDRSITWPASTALAGTDGLLDNWTLHWQECHPHAHANPIRTPVQAPDPGVLDAPFDWLSVSWLHLMHGDLTLATRGVCAWAGSVDAFVFHDPMVLTRLAAVLDVIVAVEMPTVHAALATGIAGVLCVERLQWNTNCDWVYRCVWVGSGFFVCCSCRDVLMCGFVGVYTHVRAGASLRACP
jgi:hypothetical protein